MNWFPYAYLAVKFILKIQVLILNQNTIEDLKEYEEKKREVLSIDWFSLFLIFGLSYIGFHKPVLTVYQQFRFPLSLWKNFCTTIQMLSKGKFNLKFLNNIRNQEDQ